jgi:hypothetical protein
MVVSEFVGSRGWACATRVGVNGSKVPGGRPVRGSEVAQGGLGCAEGRFFSRVAVI